MRLVFSRRSKNNLHAGDQAAAVGGGARDASVEVIEPELDVVTLHQIIEPEDMGAATAARAIEPLCILWCIPGMTGGGWNHALKLLRK